MRKLISFFLLAPMILLVIPFSQTSAVRAAGALRVGAACVDTTPVEFPVKVNGSFAPAYLSEVSDPLHARAIVVDDGAARFAFCTVDACGMNDALRDEIAAEVAAQSDLDADRILIASTHCHSAPALTLILGCDADEKYVAFVKPKITEAILTACANRVPAQVGFGTAQDRENVFCRRFLMKPDTAWSLPSAFTGSKRDVAMMNPGVNNPNAITRTGVPDPEVSVLAFETLDGKPLALLANYSLHYAGASGVSSDYFGLFCEKIAQKLGADDSFVAMMTNGTSGDVNAVDFLDPARQFTKETVSESVAGAAFAAYQSITFTDSVPLSFADTKMTLAIRKPSESDAAQARAYLEKEGITEVRNAQDLYAFDTVALFDDPGTRTLRLQAFRVGDTAIGAIPCEVYSFTGLDLKKSSPARHSFTISLANGYFGYIPTVWSFELGGYTTWRARSCCLEIEAEPKIRAEILQLHQRCFDTQETQEVQEAPQDTPQAAPQETPAPSPEETALNELVQAEWRREDKIDDTLDSYRAAAKNHLERAEKMAAHETLAPEKAAAFAETLKALRQKYEAAANDANDSLQAAEALYLEIRTVKREIAFSNELLDFGELLFCKRVPGNYSHEVQQYFGWRARRGGGLFALENPGKSLKTRSILPESFSSGSVLEPRLNPDGKRIVFSWTDVPDEPYSPLDVYSTDPPERGFYHLYTVSADGSNLTQITNDSFDDTMPNWLPDGGIVFCSTRRKSNGRCHWWGIGKRWNTYTLHRCGSDGKNIETLSFNDTNEWFPVVDETGLIDYARWDYIDRDAVSHQNLWSTRPDGTNPRAVWGNATPKPLCTFSIQPVPGTGKFVFIASAHHAPTGGPVVLLDPNAGVDGLAGLTNLTPEIPYPETDETDGAISVPEFYESPYPLSEDLYLVAYSPTPLSPEGTEPAPNALGLYLLDSDGNRELIYRDHDYCAMNPIPIRASAAPPVIQSQLPAERPDWGEVSITDVCEGLGENVKREQIKELRVVQIFPKTTRDYPPIGLAGEENGRAILGTVPVEADGSAYFRVPADKPILFQVLDNEGRAYQTMRSLTYLRPGEQISCVGCHENRQSAGYAPMAQNAAKTGDGGDGRPLAMRRAPSEIAPGELGGRPFSYVETVQPILDAQCVTCHNAERTDAGMDLTGALLPADTVTGMKMFGEGNFQIFDAPADCLTRSYFALCGGMIFYGDNGQDPNKAAEAWIPRFGGRNTIQMTEPGGRYGAIGSRLMKLLDAGHENVTLTDKERRALSAWIDLNAIFYGVYEPEEQQKQLQGKQVAMPEIQ